MKYVKILGLLAVAAAALMAFAASASATTVTSPTGTLFTGTIHAESEESAVAGTKHVLLHNAIANIACESTVSAEIETHGTNVTAHGPIHQLTFTNCTNSWHVTVITAGTLEAHWTSGYNGTLTSSGATVETTRFGLSCRYKTENTDIGTLTGGNPATLDIQAAIPFHSGSGLCGGATANWTGAYKTTTSLYLDH